MISQTKAPLERVDQAKDAKIYYPRYIGVMQIKKSERTAYCRGLWEKAAIEPDGLICMPLQQLHSGNQQALVAIGFIGHHIRRTAMELGYSVLPCALQGTLKPSRIRLRGLTYQKRGMREVFFFSNGLQCTLLTGASPLRIQAGAALDGYTNNFQFSPKKTPQTLQRSHNSLVDQDHANRRLLRRVNHHQQQQQHRRRLSIFPNQRNSNYFLTSLQAQHELGIKKFSETHSCSSPRKSLVKGERFIRSEKKPEYKGPAL